MSISAVSPLLLQRYELKYMIPFELVGPISTFIENHCEMDYYSQISRDHFYIINSLYFDTPNFEFFKRKEAAVQPSWSMRVRSYGANPKPPVFSELKLKINDFSNKMRAKIYCDNWAHVLESGEIPTDIDGKSRSYLENFIWHMNAYGAGPKILTQYRRKAYLSVIDQYARVTFDRDMRYQLEEGFNVTPYERAMCHYDTEDIFPHPSENVVLELKCEKRVPIWMLQLIKKFDLTRSGFSKYRNAIKETRIEPAPALDFQAWGR